MKKISTILSVVVIANIALAQTMTTPHQKNISSLAQISSHQKNVSNKITDSSVELVKSSKASLGQNVLATQSMYIDYSVANGDDLFYVWRFNSNYVNADTSINYAAVAIDQIAGYTDPSDPINSFLDYNSLGMSTAYPSYVVMTIDSIFAYLTHENNSSSYDKLTISLNTTDNNGKPTSTVLWSQVDSFNVTQSSGGNWVGTGAGFTMNYTPGYTTNAGQKVAIVLTYNDVTKQDTFSLLAGCIDDGTGGTMQQSNYQNSFMRLPPNIPNVTKNKDVGYGNPVGSSGWFEAQNWALWAHVTFNTVGIDEEFTNGLKLYQNTPNPFKGSTFIGYELEKRADIGLEVSDLTGKKVISIIEGHKNAGKHKIDLNSSRLKPGIYFYTLVAGTTRLTKKLTITE